MERTMTARVRRTPRSGGAMLRLTLFLLGAGYGAGAAFATPAPINISQVPLTVTIPAHPQVIIAMGNSQSVDGTLAGAIMSGSGALAANLSFLQNSSSPVNYTIPTGFTPPLNSGSGGTAPYTVTSASLTCSAGGLCVCPAGDQCDNSASRLNVAKAAMWNVINLFMQDTDFALMDYCASNSSTTNCSTAGVGGYTTWLYTMSPPGGFVFTNTQTAGNTYLPNPCYQFFTTLAAGNPIYNDCLAIHNSGVVTLSTGFLTTAQWMQIASPVGTGPAGTSDDPQINDVLYAGGGGWAPICIAYGGPNPPNAWPYNAVTNPNGIYTLGEYNANPSNIVIRYSNAVNGACATATYPTNAGPTPSAPQTMYIERGFGFDNGNDQCYTVPCNGGAYWAPVVPMTSAGQYPTTATLNTALAKFTSWLAPETNSTGTTEIKAIAEQSPLAGLLANAQAYYTHANPPSSVPGCTVQRYVILLTDGLPTQDLRGHSWPPPGSIGAQNYGVTVAFNGDGSLDTTGGTNDQAVLDVVSTLQSMSSAANPIKTYVIGLGAGATTATASQVLTSFAIAGGTSRYFAATDTATMFAALQTILTDVQAATQATSTSAINSTGLHVGSMVYQAQFTTKDLNQDWTGNLFAFPVDPNTGFVNTNTSDAVWNAQALLDSQPWQTGGAGRIIATWDPAANGGLGAGTPFEWTTGTPSSGIATSTTLGQDLASNPADTSGQDALDYLRGDRALEQGAGGPYRTRTHVLADIVDSAPLYVGAPSGFYQSASYTTFQQRWASRPPVLYVGGDDGMLHAFDVATGIERFAYIPNGVFPNLVNLTYQTYNENHQFFVDGSPAAWDVQFSDSSWHTILVSGEGAGGKSIFALDITDPADMTSESSVASDVLWEFSDANLGLTFSAPSLALTNAGTLLFFGNGYNSTTQQPYVYALNPQTGAVIAKINLCAAVTTACNATTPNGLSTLTLVNSTGSLAGPANVLYAGDLQGNVWRVDISNANPGNWTASVLSQAVDSSGNPQPITTQPLVSLNPDFPRLPGVMVFVGTGQLLSTSDLTTTQTQSLYGLYDAMPNGSAITRSNLVQQTLTAGSVLTVNLTTVNTVVASSNLVTLPSQMGWYIDFSLNPGERVITDPALVASELIVTTDQPSVADCQTNFDSWYYEFNYADGGRFPQPMFDVTESGSVSNSEPNVSGMFLGNVYSSGPRVVSGVLGGGTENLDILINESAVATAAGAYSSYGQNQLGQPCVVGSAGCNPPVENAGTRAGNQSRTAWWEIR